METFKPMTRVRLQGLSRGDLNGAVALVLPPADDAEEARLRETGRVKVTHYPAPLSLRPENLVLALWPDFLTPPMPFTILQVVRRDPAVVELCEEAARTGEELGYIGEIGGLDAPGEFAETLWKVYGDATPSSALPPDLEQRVLDSPGHRLFWISLEQLQHHVVVEACDFVWRGFQAYGKQAAVENEKFQEFQGVLLQGDGDREASGYSASEWASAEPVGSEPAAHESWGGGRDLLRGEVSAVLRLVQDLQQQTQRIVEKLREQAPRGFGIAGEAGDEAIAAWAQEMLQTARITMTPSRPGTPRTGIQGYAETDGVWIFLSGVEPEYDLQIPANLARPFVRDFARLTGEYPQGRVFLGMLVFLGWEHAELEDGGRMGWTLRSVDLRSRGRR